MKRHIKLADARSEAEDALARHQKILDDVEQHVIHNNGSKDAFLYLMAIPMIYAAWEGFFRVSCSICLRRKFYQGKKIKNYEKEYAALWLQKEGFLDSFLDTLFGAMSIGRQPRKINGSRYKAIAKFTGEFKAWLDMPANHMQNFDELVMTYSNVNKDVAEINSKVIGLDLSAVKLGRLNDLLGRRNEIAHGGLIDYPSEQTVKDLLSYTRVLLNDFNGAVTAWFATS